MPKKFVGENSKAVVAKARKEAQKSEQREKEHKEKEDRYWAEEDKNVIKKQQRKEEMERKKEQLAEKKRENAKLYEEEQAKLKSSRPSTAPDKKPAKVSLAAIEARKEEETRQRIAQQQEKESATSKLEAASEEVEENLNRANADTILATTIDTAIKALSIDQGGESMDRHPEKRMKALYTAFEERRLPLLKQENPSLRMSQLKQMLYKEWQKDEGNPLRK